MGQNPEFYLAMEISFTLIFEVFYWFTMTVSNLSVWSTYLTNIKLGPTKDGRMFSVVAQFKMDSFHKKNGQNLQRKVNMTYTHFDG